MKKLEKACRKRRVSQNTIFKDPMTGKVYSNVYCFLCNNPDQIEIPWMCQVEDMSSSDDVTFSAMIGEFSNGGVRNGPCEDTEVQDKFTVRLVINYKPLLMGENHNIDFLVY
jgi:hypothetical protein